MRKSKKNAEKMMKKKDKRKKRKRINYDPVDIEKALKAMKDTGLSLRKAAAAYGIPVATLGRKKNLDPERTRNKPGPETVLSSKEEDDIVKWVLSRAEMGAPVTKTELLDCVQKYVQTIKKETPFTDHRPSRHWYEGIRKRHPQLSVRKPQHLSTSRAAVSREELQDWFRDTGKYLEDKNLSDICPTRIFNCDESSILLCPDAERVIAEKGSRAVYKIVDGGREALTVLFMYRADGTRAPPMLMYSFKKNVPRKIVDNIPIGWGIEVSDSGWMTAETFYEYITNVFYPWLVEEKSVFPVIVFMDNHSSHLNLPLVNFCREKQIELVMLPPNSTHIMQPLDISFFHPFKVTWKKCVPKWKNQQGITRIKKEDFPLVLKFTLDNMKDEKSVVISGFRGSGLYPFDSKAVDYDILKKRKKSKPNNDQKDSDNSNSDNVVEGQQFLQIFERSLPVDTLSEFKVAAMSGSWTGHLEKKALFDYWFEIHKKAMGNTLKQKPVIKKIEILNDVLIQRALQNKLNVNQPCSSDNVDSNTNSSMVSTNDGELSINIQPIDLVNSKEVFQSIALVDNNSNTINCEGAYSVDDEQIYEFVYESDQITHQVNPTFNQNHPMELTKENFSQQEHVHMIASNDDELNNETVVNKVSEAIDQDCSNTSYKNPSITIDKVNSEANSQTTPLQEIFTLPLEYLPKTKRIKVEKTGKSKLPAVGTSDTWYKLQLEKENIKKQKEEKQKNKKKLQEEKKN